MKRNASLMLAAACTFLSHTPAMASTIVTFESVALGAPNGPAGVWNGQAGGGGLTLDGVSFNNSYTNYGGGFFGWDGFSFSNLTNTTTPGFGNQFSAITGAGAGGSSQYAIGGEGGSIQFAAADLLGTGAYLTNTTYATLSMLAGDSFAKKFGGASGDDPDFFKLTISGYAGGVATGTTVDFYLADFRFTDNSQDYIVRDWTFVDFSPLGTVDELRFDYASSDVGGFGINTPKYFALDQLFAIPEPSSAALLMLGGLGLLVRRRR